MYDLVILGGGPAGVSAGVYASRKRIKTLIITKDFNGQSSVSEGIENWIGEVKIPGLELSKKFENHLRAYAGDIVDIHTNEYCSLIEKNANATDPASPTAATRSTGFTVKTNKGTYTTKTLLVTTGSHRRKLDVKGADIFEHKGLTYCASCDGPLYADQDVVVVGGGNAGFESAAQLLAYCKSVTILNRSENLKADPTTVAAVKAHPKAKLIMNAIPKEVKGDKFVSSIVYTDALSKTDTELNVTGIFVEIGSTPTTDFVKDIVALTPFGNIVVDPKTQRASTDGIWAAGDCTDGIYHQNNIAAGDAIKALEDIYIYISKK